MILRETKYLLQKELLLEFRQKYALGGILLYVVSTIFVCYLSFSRIINIPTWNALFWVIMLFTATNAISKSFTQESKGMQLYLYSLVSPQAVIISKIVYNVLLMLVLAAISLGAYAMLIGSNPLENADLSMFLTALLLGGVGFSGVLTMIAAIASKTDNNLGLMAILGFPVILPLLTAIMKLSKAGLDGLDWSVNYKYAAMIGALNLMVLALSYLLFPYLWRE